MNGFAPEDLKAAEGVLAAARQRQWTISTAESCTGGLIAALLTEIPGASDVFTRGFVTYANDAKMDMLDVPAALLAQFGAVSSQTAAAMADGGRKASGADFCVAVTGIAGPGGGTPTKPVGLVFMAIAAPHAPALVTECQFGALSRSEIRGLTVRKALAALAATLQTY